MIKVQNIPIVGKFIVVLGFFGVVTLLSAVYSTHNMRQIDDAYTLAIETQGFTAFELSKANRAFIAARAAIAEAAIAVTEDGNRRAAADLKKAASEFAGSMEAAKKTGPAYSTAIEDIQLRAKAILEQTCAKAIKLGLNSTGAGAAAAAQADYLQSCSPAFPDLTSDLTDLTQKAKQSLIKTDMDLTPITNHTILMTYAAAVGGLVLVVIIGFFAISAWVSRPIRAMVNAMTKLADNDFSVDVVGIERRDEIGPMARSVQVFKDNGLRLRQAESDAAQAWTVAEEERVANEAKRAELEHQQKAVVLALASGLDRLSKGDLTGRLSQVFAEEYEKLRTDFNSTADSLQDALRTITVATDGISTGSDQIAHASDDLSRRTEQQAASLEETAAALNVITDTVRTMAANAGAAAKVVITTRSAAESSGAIVQQAVDAMGKIKESSQQITNIIGVIDEIAFQTNLLALNAGVEAARAGDAGRGFAVVASEVRGLAQRSAEAAKEIKALISASTVQVESGVVLVDKTGVALKEIIVRVAEMDGLVRQISAASQEQATGLAEINTAVSQMDQVVQQNAAMVEESTAAAHALKAETQDLTMMVGRFDIGEDRQAGARGRGNPVHAAQAKLAKSITRPTARPMLKTTGSAAHK